MLLKFPRPINPATSLLELRVSILVSPPLWWGRDIVTGALSHSELVGDAIQLVGKLRGYPTKPTEEAQCDVDRTLTRIPNIGMKPLFMIDCGWLD